ncbi:MAG: CRISPR-associated endonuclease Cas1 [Arachnia propionica]|uniref:CRISPR-associated endonuclease Cas1 n=1 Tax=Arachnia propionica TaxID=1750 RepID=UPI0026F9F13A|nr:CRISPR-associated endonuclease Cas1 [Arachnia propionica]
MTTSMIPISLVANTAFCPRRTWLEAVGEVVASFNMEAGQAAHSRVDSTVGTGSQRRSVQVEDPEWGVYGTCDVVDVADGTVEVVEFKATPGKREPTVSEANRIQLALQRRGLEAQGHVVSSQRVYFTNHRCSVPVEVDDELLAEAHRLVEVTREIVEGDTAPAPLLEEARCRFCSHAGVCLPEERRWAPVKRVMVPDPHGEILHLTVPGARASLRRGRVIVQKGDEDLTDLPIERVAGIVVHGNVDLSTALVREGLYRGISIVWCSGRGRVIGFGRSASSPNGGVRAVQLHTSLTGDMGLADELIASKISNQATLLRRNAKQDCSDRVKELRTLAGRAGSAATVEELLGHEGRAARVYFEAFPVMLSDASWIRDSWPGRHGRGAVDPLNVALNYTYGLLLSEVVRAVHACGLDPHLGFVHSSTRNKPALALDLMEQFRPLLADSTVVMAINNKELTPDSFCRGLGDHRLTDSGRRAITASFERRIAQEFRHPVFTYKVSWRRAVEVQARMLLGYLDGSQDRYVGVRTR